MRRLLRGLWQLTFLSAMLVGWVALWGLPVWASVWLLGWDDGLAFGVVIAAGLAAAYSVGS